MENPQHLIIDLHNCSEDVCKDQNSVTIFMRTSIEKMEMSLVGNINTFYFKGPKPEDDGITSFAVLAESHLSYHSYPQSGVCYIDLFSCKPFDTCKMIQYAEGFFDGQSLVTHVSRLSTKS